MSEFHEGQAVHFTRVFEIEYSRASGEPYTINVPIGTTGIFHQFTSQIDNATRIEIRNLDHPDWHGLPGLIGDESILEFIEPLP